MNEKLFLIGASFLLTIGIFVGLYYPEPSPPDEFLEEMAGRPVLSYREGTDIQAALSEFDLQERSYQTWEVPTQTLYRHVPSMDALQEDQTSISYTTYWEEPRGITIYIHHPEAFQRITAKMYQNTLLTGGLVDADVHLFSGDETSGEHALFGILDIRTQGKDDEYLLTVAMKEMRILSSLHIPAATPRQDTALQLGVLQMKRDVLQLPSRANTAELTRLIYANWKEDVLGELPLNDLVRLQQFLQSVQESPLRERLDVQRAYERTIHAWEQEKEE